MAGHSLGEYSALVCSNVIKFSDAIRVVEIRGHLMNDAVPNGAGAMFAIIGLDDLSIKKICEESAQGQIVAPVNFNAPGQVVIAGNKEAVERAIKLSRKRGAKRTIFLPVSVPSHCKLMKNISSKFLLELEKITFSMPSIPIVNNVDVRVETDSNAIRNALIRQLYSPVRWTEIIYFMVSKGITNMFEIGPGSILTGLNRRIDSNLKLASINDPLFFSSIIEKYI
jgi:[acyl-carrier-protein] S-malonyltransferase